MGDGRVPPVLQLKDVLSYKNLVHAVAGATGSSIAITAFYPLDIARTRLQVEDGRQSKLSALVCKDIVDDEGIVGLYRGWFPVVTSVCCSNFVYFYVFNGLKAIAYKGGVQPYPTKDLILAFIAGVANVIITTPMWVANTRLKLQGIKLKAAHGSKSTDTPLPKTNYSGIIDAMCQIYRKEGVTGLWASTIPSIVLAINPAVQFMVYEALKRRLQTNFQSKDLSATAYFLMGALAKAVATFVTYPIQLIQSRLRAGQGKDGTIKCIQQLIKSQGWLSLYKGLEAKMTQTVAMAALMFLTYEKIAATVFRLMRHQQALARAAAKVA
jgi:adenine nucleotide transporter 17